MAELQLLATLGVRWALRQLVCQAAVPAQEGDHDCVDRRSHCRSCRLGTVAHVVRRARSDRLIAVLVWHGKNLLTVACHLSSIPGSVVASHLEQGV